jgi:hypothetical protein
MSGGAVTIDSWGEKYLRLGLRMDKHIPGYVDAYVGPPALREAVSAEEPRSPAALLEDVAELRQELPGQGYEAGRQAFLGKLLRAIETMVRKVAGETFSYREEVERCFDIVPPWVGEERFADAHAEMERILPGTGPLRERMQAYRDRFIVPEEQVMPLVQTVLAEVRRRTRELVPLPENEAVEVTMVRGQPWGAYNWFLGQARSRIELNMDLPTRAHNLLELFAHEAYPGHHTELVLKEHLLYYGRGYAEQAIYLLHTPVSVTAEGIGDSGAQVIFTDAERIEWQNEALFPQAGLPRRDVEQALRLEQATQDLRFVSGNAALLLHEQGRPAEEVVDYIARWSLRPHHEAEHLLRFIQSPLFRAYVFCYATGEVLIERAMEHVSDRRAFFRRLLTEQWTPAGLLEVAGGKAPAP